MKDNIFLIVGKWYERKMISNNAYYGQCVLVHTSVKLTHLCGWKMILSAGPIYSNIQSLRIWTGNSVCNHAGETGKLTVSQQLVQFQPFKQMTYFKWERKGFSCPRGWSFPKTKPLFFFFFYKSCRPWVSGQEVGARAFTCWLGPCQRAPCASGKASLDIDGGL